MSNGKHVFNISAVFFVTLVLVYNLHWKVEAQESFFQRLKASIADTDTDSCSSKNCVYPSDSLLPRSITALAVPVTEDFDTLANTGTSSALPTGWEFTESGTNANTTYTANNGSLSTGDTYSYGATNATDRAFGGLRSGSLIPIIGASFTNATGSSIASIKINYTGEQWRLGQINRGADRIEFEYSTDATSLTTGTWTKVPELNFETPDISGSAGQRDGNLAANRRQLSKWFNVNVPNNNTIWIRWVDVDVSGADDGLAVDDFSLTAYAVPTAAPASISGRVVSEDGRGLSGAIVTLVGGDLVEPVSLRTNSFGFYRIDNLPVGRIYLLTATAPKFAAASETRAVELIADLADVNFMFSAGVR
ncbi:MAG: carboxypeptidase regulatory-like domain-containing protein [Pyrinomonadaceae bacterium]